MLSYKLGSLIDYSLEVSLLLLPPPGQQLGYHHLWLGPVKLRYARMPARSFTQHTPVVQLPGFLLPAMLDQTFLNM